MSRFIIKQKIFSIGTDFTIKDGNGSDVFYVDGYGFSIGKKFSFQDMKKQELAKIRQSLFTFSPKYKITNRSGLMAVVKKRRFSLRDNFIVDVPGPNDLSVTGSFVEHEYRFSRKGTTVAEVTRKMFRTSDTYAVDIVESVNPVLILACVVVIDMICHDPKSTHNR